MTWKNIDPTQLPFPKINNRCVLYDRAIPSDSIKPEHLDLCRQGPCGHHEGSAEDIVEHTRIINRWQTDPKICSLYQKLLETPMSQIEEPDIVQELKKLGVPVKRYNEQGFIPDNPVSILFTYLKTAPIHLTLNPLKITNGRHRICAAKKFGVKNLLVKDISSTPSE